MWISRQLNIAVNGGLDLKKNLNELQHDKANKMICAPNKDSDQPGHPPSLIRVFAVHIMGSQGPIFLYADSRL